MVGVSLVIFGENKNCYLHYSSSMDKNFEVFAKEERNSAIDLLSLTHLVSFKVSLLAGLEAGWPPFLVVADWGGPFCWTYCGLACEYQANATKTAPNSCTACLLSPWTFFTSMSYTLSL